MKGARIRANSLGGTRPASTSASVPRLMAPNSARTRTSPAPGDKSASWRMSACPGPLYQSASATSSGRLIATLLLSPDWTLRRFAVLYHRVCTVRRRIRSRNRVLERSPPQAVEAAAGNDISGRRVLFAVLFAATMAGSLSLAALALAPGGFGIADIMLLALFAVTLPWMVAGL